MTHVVFKSSTIQSPIWPYHFTFTVQLVVTPFAAVYPSVGIGKFSETLSPRAFSIIWTSRKGVSDRGAFSGSGVDSERLGTLRRRILLSGRGVSDRGAFVTGSGVDSERMGTLRRRILLRGRGVRRFTLRWFGRSDSVYSRRFSIARACSWR
jgi:hypothetical protein